MHAKQTTLSSSYQKMACLKSQWTKYQHIKSGPQQKVELNISYELLTDTEILVEDALLLYRKVKSDQARNEGNVCTIFYHLLA